MTTRMNQTGDTIVEVIFSLVILSSVLVATFGLARNSRLNSQNALMRTQAINMVQEQYEALKSQRNIYPWVNFAITSGEDGAVRQATAEHYGCDPGNSLKLGPQFSGGIPTGPCYFHMERDVTYQTLRGGASNGADYGEWEACPDFWYPPLGIDNSSTNGWSAGTDFATYAVAPVNNEPGYMFDSSSGPVPYFGTYGPLLPPLNPTKHIGCRGNGRTQSQQPNISVKIFLNTLLPDSSCAVDGGGGAINTLSFTIVATWKQGGSNATNISSLDAIVGNNKGEPPC